MAVDVDVTGKTSADQLPSSVLRVSASQPQRLLSFVSEWYDIVLISLYFSKYFLFYLSTWMWSSSLHLLFWWIFRRTCDAVTTVALWLCQFTAHDQMFILKCMTHPSRIKDWLVLFVLMLVEPKQNTILHALIPTFTDTHKQHRHTHMHFHSVPWG